MGEAQRKKEAFAAKNPGVMLDLKALQLADNKRRVTAFAEGYQKLRAEFGCEHVSDITLGPYRDPQFSPRIALLDDKAWEYWQEQAKLPAPPNKPEAPKE